jgi:hypothetical protein
LVVADKGTDELVADRSTSPVSGLAHGLSGNARPHSRSSAQHPRDDKGLDRLRDETNVRDADFRGVVLIASLKPTHLFLQNV